MGVLTGLAILTMVGVWLAALGRQSMPRAERLPVSQWGWREVIANVAIGYRQLVALHERRWWTASSRDHPGG